MTLLLDVIDYCRRTRTPEAAFGRLALNDPNLIGDMRKGRIVKPKTESWLRAGMAMHPDGPPREEAREPRPTANAPTPRKLAAAATDDSYVPLCDSLARGAAYAGSLALQRATLRLGLKVGGVPGLDETGFRAACAQAGLIIPKAWRGKR